MEIPGFTRRELHRRFVYALQDVIQRKVDQEDREPTMATETVTKVTLAEAVERLIHCPVCGQGLYIPISNSHMRFCECGKFTITEVFSDGDVVFEFHMFNPEKRETDEQPTIVELHTSEAEPGD